MTTPSVSGLRAAGVLVAAIATMVALVAVTTARRIPGASATADSVPATVFMLGAGLILVVVGLEQVRRQQRRRRGLLLAWTGITWLLAGWAYPAAGSAPVFTVGLVLGWLTPAAATHALLAQGRDRPTTLDRVLVFAGYAIFGVGLGVLPALTFDARSTGCSFCPPDLLAFAPSAGVAGAVTAGGTLAGTTFAVVAGAALVADVVRQTSASRMHRSTYVIPGALYLLTVALELGRSAGRETIPAGGATHTIQLLEGAFLAAVGLGIAWGWWRARLLRRRVARVVANLVESPPVGALRDALASSLNDPDLQVAYPIAGQDPVDAEGRAVDLGERERPGRIVTRVVRDGVVVALIEHRTDDPHSTETLGEVIRTAQLGLEHERLRAATRAQLASLTAARKRIVAAAAAERRRLERDLHDGSQQRLIAIAVGLRLLTAGAPRSDARARALIGDADREISRAIDELREVAHGIYPSVLSDEGLAAAIEGVAEGATVPVRVGHIEVDRLEPAVAEAAYAVVSEVVTQGSGSVDVSATRDARTLTVIVSGPDLADDLLVELGDRIGAVEGILAVAHPARGRMELRAEIPCAS